MAAIYCLFGHIFVVAFSLRPRKELLAPGDIWKQPILKNKAISYKTIQKKDYTVKTPIAHNIIHHQQQYQLLLWIRDASCYR